MIMMTRLELNSRPELMLLPLRDDQTQAHKRHINIGTYVRSSLARHLKMYLCSMLCYACSFGRFAFKRDLISCSLFHLPNSEINVPANVFRVHRPAPHIDTLFRMAFDSTEQSRAGFPKRAKKRSYLSSAPLPNLP